MPCLVELLALLSTVLAAAEVADCHSAPAVRYEPRSFLGYACEDDCQRHKAGFAWAERHRVTDVAAASTSSPPQPRAARRLRSCP